MGLFDFLGPVLAYAGTQDTNEANTAMAAEQRAFNAAEAQKSRDWQQKQSETQYQRAVADLQAANLNPMLAYQHGGNQAMPGATASSNALPELKSPLSALAHGAQQARQLQLQTEQVRNIAADTKVKESAADVNKATEKEIEARTPVHPATIAELGTRSAQQASSAKQLEAHTQSILAGIPKIAAEINQIKAQTEHEYTRNMLTSIQQELTTTQEKLARAEITNTQARTQLLQTQNKLQGLAIPGAANKSEIESSAYGRALSWIDRTIKSLSPLTDSK